MTFKDYLNLLPNKLPAAPNKGDPITHPEYKVIPKRTANSWDITPYAMPAVEDVAAPANTPTVKFSQWDIQPLSLFDDVPDDETLRQHDAENAFTKLLESSNLTLQTIHNYLIAHNVNYIPTGTVPPYYTGQTFTLNEKTYILDDEKILKEIYLIMLDLRNPFALRHALNRRPNLLENLERHLPTDDSFIKDPMLCALPQKLLIKQITKTLSFMISNKLIIEKNPKLQFRLATVAQSLGTMLLDSYITMHYIYIDINDYLTNTFMRSAEEDGPPNKDGIYEFSKRSTIDIQTILTSLHSNTAEYLNYTQVQLEPELREIVMYSLISHCINRENPIQIPFKYDAVLLDKKLVIYSTTLGIKVISWLKSLGLFSEIIDKKGVPRLVYEVEHAVNLLASSSFYKPPISTTPLSTAYATRIGDKISLTLDLKHDTVKSSKSVQLNVTPKLQETLTSYKNMPMRVDTGQYEYFTKLFAAMLIKPDVSTNDPITVAFLYTLFDIDFAILTKNNTNKALVEKLAKFGLDFNIAFDKDLQTECENNLACINAYNIISSYKFYIKGFISELNLYTHFNHFYIPHYITSTGRIFSSPYYLQLQGNKFAKAFITFIKCRKLTFPDIVKVEDVMKTLLPSIPKHYFFTSKADVTTADVTEQRFNQNNRGLFNTFLFSFFKEGRDTNIASYPYESDDVTEQLLWLSANCKKQFELLYVRLILHAGFADDYEHLIMEKDATGSGTQIISMLLRNTEMAKRTNIINTTNARDLYADITCSFENNLTKQIACFEDFCQTILNKSSSDFINTPENKTVGYLLKSLLMTSTLEEFSSVYSLLAPKLKESSLHDPIIHFNFPVTNLSTSSLRSTNPDPLYKALLRTREYLKNKLIFEQFPAALINRKLFKIATMALGYAQGEDSRKQSFKEQIIEHFISQGYAQLPLSTADLNDFVELLSFSFNVISKELLNPIQHFLNITTDYTRHTPDININMTYLSWSLRITEALAFRHRMTDGSLSRHFTLYHTFGISKEQMGITFPSVFVQGIDAHIVHFLLDKINQINLQLRAHNIPQLSVLFCIFLLF